MTQPNSPKPRSSGKQRLDQRVLLLARLTDLKVAQGLIMAGKVVVDGAVADKPGTLIAAGAKIHLREIPLRFASRGGYKLEHALRRFRIDVRGLVCLDAGASTGGFTDCLLQNGASRVYAVEVGYGQLRGKLAADPRVVSLERTNLSDLAPADLHPPIQFACADLSYLSLRKSVSIIEALFAGAPRVVCLVKPLYEGLAQDDIADRTALASVLRKLLDDLHAQGHAPSDACVSPILGGRGAIEFLFQFGAREPQSPAAIARLAIEDLDQNPPVHMPEEPPAVSGQSRQN